MLILLESRKQRKDKQAQDPGRTPFELALPMYRLLGCSFVLNK
jgi:hypothetical protein